MTPAELRSLCAQLGYGWQTWLAKALRCHVRTVQRWASGERKIGAMVEDRIREVIKKELRKRR